MQATAKKRRRRLQRIEKAAQQGKASPNDVLWLVRELRARELSPLPSFELAPLDGIASEVLRPRSEFDRVMLTLALIFNDFKDLTIIHTWMKPSLPRLDEVSPFAGQFTGLHNHLTRLAAGAVHETLNYVHGHRRVFDSEEFVELLKTTPKRTQDSWKLVRRLADRDDEEGAQGNKSLFNAVKEIRDRAAFHYAHDKKLANGYDDFFLNGKKTARSAKAFLSVGKNMEATRFYFADAAVRSQVARIEKNKGIPVQERLNETLQDLNYAIGPVVANFVATRSGRSENYFAPPSATMDAIRRTLKRGKRKKRSGRGQR